MRGYGVVAYRIAAACIAPAKLLRVRQTPVLASFNAFCDNPTPPWSYYSLHGFTVGIYPT